MLDETSLKRLSTVKENLRLVVLRAVAALPFQIRIVEGIRTQDRQNELYEQGRTKPGKMVTWTRNSKHLTGDAIDLAPVQNGIILWEDKAKFAEIKQAMMKASDDLGIGIRWGGNWDMDNIPYEKGETDLPHFELTGKDKKWESNSLLVPSLQQSSHSLEPNPTANLKVETKPTQPEIKKTLFGKLMQLLKPLTRK